MDATISGLRRREFIKLLAAGALGAGLGRRSALGAQKSGEKPLRGVFPIAQTPFTDANKLDLNALAEQVKFIDRGGVHGFVWPQMASEYSTLSESERTAGAEAIVSTGRQLRPAIVIGVQGPDIASAVRYARHATKIGADAVIAIPPAGGKDAEAAVEYYRAIGKATDLPLFVQSVGAMTVELLVRMANEIPTLRYVKDEAGRTPLARIGPLRRQSRDRLKVFTGGHGVTMIDEMRRGSSGSMPAAALADLYGCVWDWWQAGKRKEAMDLFGKALLFVMEVQAYGLQTLKYLLHLRGVFPTYRVRADGGAAPLDESAKQTLGEMLEFVKPYLKA
jgi:4-hydroxy-tetrahydrodipicolinate synthase